MSIKLVDLPIESSLFTTANLTLIFYSHESFRFRLTMIYLGSETSFSIYSCNRAIKKEGETSEMDWRASTSAPRSGQERNKNGPYLSKSPNTQRSRIWIIWLGQKFNDSTSVFFYIGRILLRNMFYMQGPTHLILKSTYTWQNCTSPVRGRWILWWYQRGNPHIVSLK